MSIALTLFASRTLKTDVQRGLGNTRSIRALSFRFRIPEDLNGRSRRLVLRSLSCYHRSRSLEYDLLG